MIELITESNELNYSSAETLWINLIDELINNKLIELITESNELNYSSAETLKINLMTGYWPNWLIN